ncbi:MAG: lysophospholipase [Myxococcota bacterium]|nr:lysophospholipase [Myxococcota bacterium]
MQFLKATSDDGTHLRLARWGSGEKDALIVHGLAEHAGRYTHVAEALVDAGWRVTLVELRGHGESRGKPGHCKFWHRYVEDVQAAAVVVGRPYVLVAHSMGGLVTLDALREPITPRCVAVAASNPFLALAEPLPAWKDMAARIASRLVPSLSIPTELDTANLTHDVDVVRAYEADPLVYGTVTARWGVEMEKAQQRVMADAPKGRIPLRMMIGTGDRICDPQAARRLARDWGGEVDEVIYDGLYHELFNENERAAVIRDMITWMDATWATHGAHA